MRFDSRIYSSELSTGWPNPVCLGSGQYECRFGPAAALYDCIVKMLPGRTANFSIRPVAVTGTFGIKELKGPDGSHLAVYSLTGESVR